MANGNRTGDPRGFNKGRSSKFREGSRVRQTPEEGRRTYWPKRCGNNNKDEDNSLKTLNDKNQQALSQKFRHQISREDVRRIRSTLVWKKYHPYFKLSSEFNQVVLVSLPSQCLTIFITDIINYNLSLNFEQLMLKHCFKIAESVIASLRVFCAHFMLC